MNKPKLSSQLPVTDDLECNKSESDSDAFTFTTQTRPQMQIEEDDSCQEEHAKAESRNVIFLYRLFVLAVLLISMIGVALTVHIYVSSSEKRAFEDQFREHARKVLDAIGISFDTSLSTADAFVISLVSYARYSNIFRKLSI